MTVYGYARISTPQQSIERQVRNILREAPEAIIYEEAYTGRKIERPKFSKLLKRAKAGDRIVFDSVSRMSRTAEEGYQLYQELADKGIDLVFLKEPQINTETYKKGMNVALPETDSEIIQPILDGVKKALQAIQKEQIRQAFEQAEKEVQDLRQRTREGIETARAAGKQIGRPQGTYHTKKAAAAKEIIKKHCIEFGGGLSDPEVIKLAGISRNSFYKYKRELREAD